MPDFQMGRWYEDFVVGEVIKHKPGRTILEADNTWFTLLTNNTHPIHFDAHYASKTQFGKPLVNSALTLAVVAGMTVTDTSYRSVANLEWTYIKMPAPVFAGDTLYSESEILDKRESKSRPDRGIVTIKTRAFNQRGELVMEYERKSMAAKKGMGAIPDYDNIESGRGVGAGGFSKFLVGRFCWFYFAVRSMRVRSTRPSSSARFMRMSSALSRAFNSRRMSQNSAPMSAHPTK